MTKLAKLLGRRSGIAENSLNFELGFLSGNRERVSLAVLVSVSKFRQNDQR